MVVDIELGKEGDCGGRLHVIMGVEIELRGHDACS